MKKTAIILAAGKGTRMNSDVQKQYMLIEDKPVLYYSLKTFEESSADEIILVTGEGEKEYCKKNIVDYYNLKKVATIVEGGKERYDSAYNGLKAISGECIVAIHDAARPLVTGDIIERTFECAEKYGACVAGVPAKDTIKMVNEKFIITNTPSRSTMWITQTPQTFRYEIIKDAYDKMILANDKSITDDSMVVEKYGKTEVRFVMGSYQNIKITTPEDIDIASIINRCR